MNPDKLGVPFPPLLDPRDVSNRTLSKEPSALIPIDFLDQFKEIEAFSVTWFSFELQDDVNDMNSAFLIQAAKNMFLGIPSDFRLEFYTHVEAFILEAPKPIDATASGGEGASTSSSYSTKRNRVQGNSLLIYICNFHVLSHLLLIYICKLHWNLNTMFVCKGVRKKKKSK